MRENHPVYASRKRLEESDYGPPMGHVDADCSNLDAADDVVDLTAAEAEDQCARQAQCCSRIVALEDLD